LKIEIKNNIISDAVGHQIFFGDGIFITIAPYRQKTTNVDIIGDYIPFPN
jgi:hypothetical protein